MLSSLLLKVFNNIWPMLVVFIVAITLIRFYYLRTHSEKFHFYKEFAYFLAILYIWLLFELLTMSEINVVSGINLVPFSEILRYEVGSKLFAYNVIGNIILFIPFGFIIGEYIKPKKIWPVLITTLLTSGIVEFVQLERGRSFDIDDIILNVVGSIIGYLLYVGLNAIHKRLPEIFKSETFYNILCIIMIILFGIYILGYWSVVFK